ncbi:MAG: CinA family nicotinamide mononucleotide deamidase-related protein [bacterium]|nr:CinA family nicotinamide mononucleotide deamidase-related protein [bacterium]
MEVSNLNARIIAIGDELLCGRTLETNSNFIQRQLLKYGIDVERVTVVHDNKSDIMSALDEAGQQLIFVTGGLGPTPDDMTVDVVAEWAGVPIVIDQTVEADLKKRCADRGFEYHFGMAKQAKLPQGMKALKNPVGSAPGQVGKFGGATVVLLPGVPAEMHGLWPLVEAELELSGSNSKSFRLRTVGLSEPKLSDMTESVRDKYLDLVWSWWLSKWGVDVQASGPDPAVLDSAEKILRTELGDSVFASGETELSQTVGEMLLESGKTVAVAESCTAGMVGAALTDSPGSSAYFTGGVISYSNEIKTQELAVPEQLFIDHGAVSYEVAESMAINCRDKFGTDYAISVTGISGPDGGTAEKPVGTTWIAVAAAGSCTVKRFRFIAHRARSRELTVAAALNLLRLQM